MLTVADDAGKPLGITLATSGHDVSIAGMRVRVDGRRVSGARGRVSAADVGARARRRAVRARPRLERAASRKLTPAPGTLAAQSCTTSVPATVTGGFASVPTAYTLRSASGGASDAGTFTVSRRVPLKSIARANVTVWRSP